ncbi:MAG: sensor histidine kinase [Pseudomonadota bacterium]
MRLSTTQLLKFAGLFTWASVGLALAMTPLLGRAEKAQEAWIVWAIAQVTFGAAYWWVASSLEHRSRRDEQIVLLGLMTVAALVITGSSQTGLGGILLLVVAGVLPWVLDLRYGVPWLLAQNVALAIVVATTFPDVNWTSAAILCGLYLGYSSFTFVLSLVARRQARARDELRKVNSELRATQALLAESTRIAERVRISRELHDLVGHHLTALSLNLEVASHLVDGKAHDHVAQARSVAKLLLSDVREAVGTMRTDDAVNLTEAIRSLAEGVPRPRIHLSIPDELEIDDPRRAQILLRCTQEIITNTVKHADADNLWLAVDQDGEGFRIDARDDGRGTDAVDAGNGLTGMKERLRQLGGRLAVNSAVGEGFTLNAWLPKEVSL